MRRATYAALTTLLAAALTLAALPSCGTNGPATAPGSPQADGSSEPASVAVTVHWPPRTQEAAARFIHTDTSSVKVCALGNDGKVLLNDDGTEKSLVLVRPAEGETTTSGTLVDLPYGPVTLRATAHPNADGTGTPQAKAELVRDMKPGPNGPFGLGMDCTIASVTIAPTSVCVDVGETKTLVPTALDADGSPVFVASTWEWSVADESIASVDAGVVTGLSAGETTVSLVEGDTEIAADPVPITVIQIDVGEGWHHEAADDGGSGFYRWASALDGGELTEETVGWPAVASSCLTGDIDGDGLLEVVTASSMTVRSLRANGTVEWSREPAGIESDAFLSGLVDVNGDGLREVLVGYRTISHNLRLSAYDGDGNPVDGFPMVRPGPNGSDSTFGEAFALPGGDVVVQTFADVGLTPRGPSRFGTDGSELWQYAVGPHGRGCVAGDIDNDGALEFIPVAAAAWRNVYGSGVGGNGTTTWDKHAVTIIVNDDGSELYTVDYYPDPPGGTVAGVIKHAVADLDGAAPDELIVFESHADDGDPCRIHVIDGTTGDYTTVYTGDSYSEVSGAIADVDGDSRSEIIATDTGSGVTYIIEGDGTVVTSASVGEVVAANDIDGDGEVEFITVDGSMLRIAGPTLAIEKSVPVGANLTSWPRPRVSDIDGNGVNDIVAFTTDGSGNPDSVHVFE